MELEYLVGWGGGAVWMLQSLDGADTDAKYKYKWKRKYDYKIQTQIQGSGWLKKLEGASVWTLRGLDGALSVPAILPTTS